MDYTTQQTFDTLKESDTGNEIYPLARNLKFLLDLTEKKFALVQELEDANSSLAEFGMLHQMHVSVLYDLTLHILVTHVDKDGKSMLKISEVRRLAEIFRLFWYEASRFDIIMRDGKVPETYTQSAGYSNALSVIKTLSRDIAIVRAMTQKDKIWSENFSKLVKEKHGILFHIEGVKV